MSRSASTAELTEEFYLSQISPNHKSVVSLEVFNTNTGAYQEIEDLDTKKGVNWTVSGKKEKFANFSLTPLASTINFSVVNKNGEWSNGSGTAKENVIDTETKIRLKAGYNPADGSATEWLYTSVYYLDTPVFTDPSAPQMPMINCRGRDAFKRAIGTDINLEDLSGGTDIDDLIKLIADKVGIQYSSTSIADLSAFADRVLADGVDIKKADKVLDWCMQIINPTGYQMYMEYDSTLDENILFVQQKPTIATADGVFSYRNYKSIGNSSKNADKILNRLTVISNSEIADKEEQLDQDTFTTTGSKIQSWVGESEYKRITVDQPEEITISNFSTNPESITFDLDVLNTGGVVFTVYGNKWDGDAPSFEGEAIEPNNMLNYDGTTARIENPLVVSDAECKSIADSFISVFGTPVEQARNLIWPYLYLLPEVNDLYLMWRRHIFNDNLFFVTKISYFWSVSNESTQFNFDDSGLNFSDLGDFIYDDVLDYDKGYLYDMGISTPLSTDTQIDNASDAVRVRNYAFS